MVIKSSVIVVKATILHNGKIYGSISNLCEPLDPQTLVFELNEITQSPFVINAITLKNGNLCSTFSQSDVTFYSTSELIKKYDNKLKKIDCTSTTLAQGITYSICTYQNKKGAPVKVFTFECKKDCWKFEVGTANDGYAKHTQTATVADQASCACSKGKKVVGATNADFFEINFDNAPSGICVKNGIAIANPYSARNFFAYTFNNEFVISNFVQSPNLVGQLYSAIGGREIFVKNGKVFDFSPLEPFGYTPHPRTCVGIKKNGDVLIMVVDGRIPDYSNGASIIDLARLMQSEGVENAINLDGGGSSTFLVKQQDEFVILNKPADLYKPLDLLIRPIYNSLQIVAKD